MTGRERETEPLDRQRPDGSDRTRAARLSRRAPTFAPDEADEALLRFALIDDADSGRHLRRWRELVELDDASTGSHHLLPTAYLRMEAAGSDDPDLGRLRGIHRQRWAAGRQYSAASERAMAVLVTRGIPVIGPPDQEVAGSVVEPLVLPLVVPRLTVPERAVADALDALYGAGWRLRPESDRMSVRRRLVEREWSLQLDAQPGLHLVVGVDFNPVVRDDGYSRAVWNRSAESADCRRTPGATDLLLALLSEAPDDPSSLRWAIGTSSLARSAVDFDDAEIVFSTPAAEYLLPCLVSRLESLMSADPEVGSMGRVLAAAQSALAAVEVRPAPPSGIMARQLAHRPRQARVLAASIRRHGGFKKTVERLLARPR